MSKHFETSPNISKPIRSFPEFSEPAMTSSYERTVTYLNLSKPVKTFPFFLLCVIYLFIPFIFLRLEKELGM